MARDQIAGLDFPVEVFVGRTPELIHLSHCCLACSGSVSLELLAHTKPTVIMYRVGRLFYTLGRNFFMKVKFITLVNLLAAEDPFLRGGAKYDPRAASDGGVIFPEYLTYEDRSPEMAGQIVRWLTDDACYQGACARAGQAETPARHRRCFASRCDVHPAASDRRRAAAGGSALRTGNDERRRQAGHKNEEVGLTEDASTCFNVPIWVSRASGQPQADSVAEPSWGLCRRNQCNSGRPRRGRCGESVATQTWTPVRRSRRIWQRRRRPRRRVPARPAVRCLLRSPLPRLLRSRWPRLLRRSRRKKPPRSKHLASCSGAASAPVGNGRPRFGLQRDRPDATRHKRVAPA